jgi:hypothetical protein
MNKGKLEHSENSQERVSMRYNCRALRISYAAGAYGIPKKVKHSEGPSRREKRLVPKESIGNRVVHLWIFRAFFD